MLTVKQAATTAGVSAGLVYIWVESGVLPHYRLGRPGTRGAIRIGETDLFAFLESAKHEKKPNSTPPATTRKYQPKPVFKHLSIR